MRRTVLGIIVCLGLAGCETKGGSGGTGGGRDTAAPPAAAQDTAASVAIDSAAIAACSSAVPYGAPKEIDVGGFRLQLTAVQGSIAPWEEGANRVIGILGTTGDAPVPEYNIVPGERTCWWAQSVASQSGNYAGFYVRVAGNPNPIPRHNLIFEQHPGQQQPHANPETRWNIISRKPPKGGAPSALTVAAAEAWAACASNACCRPRS